jgi:hypothetical protein
MGARHAREGAPPMLASYRVSSGGRGFESVEAPTTQFFWRSGDTAGLPANAARAPTPRLESEHHYGSGHSLALRARPIAMTL